MDAYHILLGRSWQFDRPVLHDGRMNTYNFQLEGNKIVLHPQILKHVASLIDKQVTLLSRYDFEAKIVLEG